MKQDGCTLQVATPLMQSAGKSEDFVHSRCPVSFGLRELTPGIAVAPQPTSDESDWIAKAW
jgi:hypothetical protein